MSAGGAVGAARQGTQMVLLALAAGQFLVTLDRVQMDLDIDDHDHLINPEERLRIAMARQ